jgi:hypothetical protein
MRLQLQQGNYCGSLWLRPRLRNTDYCNCDSRRSEQYESFSLEEQVLEFAVWMKINQYKTRLKFQLQIL